jgi:putative SOS response-associated peptidase YedK
MCGRFIQISDPEKIKVGIPDLEIERGIREKFKQRFNIAPTQDILTILNMPTPRLTFTHWGLIPFSARDKTLGCRMINARAETIATKPSFRESFKKRRCIILSDGFFEWKRENKTKTPYFIRMKNSEPFAFAGLWDNWTNEQTGETLISSTIITTDANPLIGEIHNRMPAILTPDLYRIWLNPLTESVNNLMKCIKPFPHDELEAFEISSLVNSPQNDSPEIIKPEAGPCGVKGLNA